MLAVGPLGPQSWGIRRRKTELWVIEPVSEFLIHWAAYAAKDKLYETQVDAVWSKAMLIGNLV